MSREKKLKFEDALQRLEEIVSILEDEKLPLEEALQRYEEGVKLTRYCAKALDAAEKKIEILSKSEEGEVGVKPFVPEGEKAVTQEKKRVKEAKAKPEGAEEQYLF